MRQLSENFHEHPSVDQQRAYFLHQQFLAQQSMMSAWQIYPPLFATWPNMTPNPFIGISKPMVTNNDYISTSYNAEIPESMQMTLSSLSPTSHSNSPRSQPNDSIEITEPGTRKKKIFKCDLCTKTFGYKHVLQNHEKVHTGEKPYSCEQCNKSFRRDHHLKVHMRLHSGEKPFTCTEPMCQRRFVQVANLRRHLKTHHKHGNSQINGALKIHKKMLESNEKENIWPLNSGSSDGSLQSRGSSQEDYDHRDYKSLDFRYESPEQSMPEDLSIKSSVRNAG